MAIQEGMTIHAVGVVTPPPPPCGNPDCGYVELQLVHDENCEEK